MQTFVISVNFSLFLSFLALALVVAKDTTAGTSKATHEVPFFLLFRGAAHTVPGRPPPRPVIVHTPRTETLMRSEAQ